MASDENIVHLTYKQLTEMAKKYDQEASKELPAERKTKERPRKNRPERAIYVPGQSHRTDMSENDLQQQGSSSGRHADRDVRSASPAAAQPSFAKQTADFTQRRRGSLTQEQSSGVSFRQSGYEHGDASVESKEDACGSSSSRPQSGDQLKKDERAQRREKKPSIQIYVPRARNQQTQQSIDQSAVPLAEGRLTSCKGSLPSEASLAPRQSHAGSTSPPVAAAVPCTLPASGSSRLPATSNKSGSSGGTRAKAAPNKKPVTEFGNGRSDKSKFDCERASRNAGESYIREAKTTACRPNEKQHSPGHGRNDNRNSAPKSSVPDELDIELEPFEWDHNADLDIGHSGGLNWGDLPTPPSDKSDNEWSDEESNCNPVTMQPGVAGHGKKKTGKRRRARKRAKAKSSETGVDVAGANPQASREFTDADNDEDPDQNEVTDQFGVMVVTNSLMKGQTNKLQCSDISNKTEFVEDYPHQAVDHESRNHVSPKSYSNARWRRDGQKERGGRNMRSARRPEQKENDCHPEKPLAAEKVDVDTRARRSQNTGVAETSRQRTDSSSSGNVGGIIRLPVGIMTSSSAPQSDALNVDIHDGNHHRQHASPGLTTKPRGGGGGGNGAGLNHRSGRAASSRVLWDPRNPDSSRVPDISSMPPPDRGNYRGTYPGEYPAYLPQQSPPVSMYYPEYMPPGTAPTHIATTDGYIYSYAAVGFDGMSYGEDPYFRGAYEQDLAAGQMRPGSRSKADQLLHEAASFDNQLQNLVCRRLHGDGAMDRLLAIRREILNRLEQLLLLDLEFSNRKNVEQLLWKSAFYQVIEMLRKQSDDEQSRRHLVAILDDGVGFFESLLQQLQTKYSFSLEPFLEPGRSSMVDSISRSTKLALITCQRIMICLGDLAQYREQANHTSNYGRARSWYTKAQHVAPKNGRPYNQLAILALYTGRKLDAVYYYMRSLGASNPFLTARESLMQLFEDAAKKAESLDRTRQLEAARRKRIAEAESRRRRRSSEQGERVEIWIGVDGSSSSQGRISAEDEDDGDDLNSLPMVELNRNFVLDFLRTHGKLFTKIGMETFPEACGRLLRELELQLAHNPLPIAGTRILQLIAVNMFAVSNTEPKDNQLDANCRSLLQEHAVQLGLDFFALLVRRCVELLGRHLASVGAGCSGMDDDLTNLIPSVKSWSDWMTCYSQLWNPPPLPLDPELGPNVDVWQSLSDLFNCLSELDTSDVSLQSQSSADGNELVVLPEDTELAGFVPLLSLSFSPVYVRSGTNKELARSCARVSKLRMFADYLCGIEPPLMSYSVESHRYVSMVTPILRTSGRPGDQRRHNSEQGQDRGSDDGDVLIEDVEETIVSAESSYASASEDGGGENAGAEQNISTLKARREELVKKVAEQTRLQENIKAAIDSTHQEFRAIQLEIRPQFLIPDTNCFIDHLRGIETIVASKKFTVVVPLVVLNELDGLSRGCRDRQYDSLEHAEMVRTGAKAAIGYLEKQFDERNSHLKALTAEGTTMTTIAFRSEQMKDPGKNDDLILSCCLYYCKDKARDFMPKSQAEPIRLQRDVVLLTNDRNLRLKAHVHNVPTRNVPAFLHWANIG